MWAMEMSLDRASAAAHDDTIIGVVPDDQARQEARC